MPDIEGQQHFPSRSGPVVSESESSADSYQGISVTSGAANTKGTYTQLIASTSKDSIGLLVSLVNFDTIARFLVDFATGAAASEVVKIPNVYVRLITANGIQSSVAFFPIYIPAGTRIAARCQSDGASKALQVFVSTVPVD